MGLQQSKSDDEVSETVTTIKTHFGKMDVRIIGENNRKNTPVICLHEAKPSLVDEWVPTARELAKKNFVVAIPNFHSNEKTKPGMAFLGIHSTDVSTILMEYIMKCIFRSDKFVLMGKAWGGFMAMQHLRQHSDTVIKAVLQAPILNNKGKIAECAKGKVPLLLCWAENDAMSLYCDHERWLEAYGDLAELFSSETGGHSIIPEYIQPIITFLEKS